MQVLVSHPFFWPHVLRGAEREVHDLGTGLARRGHRVHLVTGQPQGLTSTGRYDDLTVRYVRTPLPRALERRGVTREAAFAPAAAAGALASRADVVLSYHYADAYGVALADRAARRRRPRVLKLTGAVPRWYLDRHGSRVDRELLRRALGSATEVWVNSPYVVEAMADWTADLDAPLHVLPAGLDLELFRPSAPRSAEPTVLCTAAPADPRKRVADLLDAWPSVVESLPGARLLLAQEVGPALQAELLERVPAPLRPSVTFLGRLTGPELVQACSSAWVAVAPGVHEALGLATLEALACGTPVTGARSGATPWLLEDSATGTLYDAGDIDGLVSAVLSAADLAALPGTTEACRAGAARFSWPGILDEVEQRLGSLLLR